MKDQVGKWKKEHTKVFLMAGVVMQLSITFFLLGFIVKQQTLIDGYVMLPVAIMTGVLVCIQCVFRLKRGWGEGFMRQLLRLGSGVLLLFFIFYNFFYIEWYQQQYDWKIRETKSSYFFETSLRSEENPRSSDYHNFVSGLSLAVSERALVIPSAEVGEPYRVLHDNTIVAFTAPYELVLLDGEPVFTTSMESLLFGKHVMRFRLWDEEYTISFYTEEMEESDAVWIMSMGKTIYVLPSSLYNSLLLQTGHAEIGEWP